MDAHPEEVSAPWAAMAGADDDVTVGLHQTMGEVAAAAAQVAQAGTANQVEQARQVLAGARRALYRILADGDDTADPAAPPAGGAPDTGPDRADDTE